MINTLAIAMTLALAITLAPSSSSASVLAWAADPPAAMKPAPPAAPPVPAGRAGMATPQAPTPDLTPVPAIGPMPPPSSPAAPSASGPAATPPEVPEVRPAAPAEPPAANPVPPPAAVAPAAPAPLDGNAGKDQVNNPGYLPGYRTSQSYSMSPFAPSVGSLPGGVTPGFGAPMPLGQWTFRFSGFFTASLQGSLDRRRVTTDGQSGPLFHVPPQTLDEYGSFVGTSTMPGQWVALNFAYGNPVVSANISINTWNPSDPSTYYQIGSQYFINNAYLRFDLPPIGALKLRANAGYFYNYYGNLSQYGPGMYTQSILGSPRGVGELIAGEYQVSPELTLIFEDGIMGSRNGKVPDGIVPTGGNSGNSPIFPASFVHHLHLGVLHVGSPTIKAQVHWLTNFAQDDRVQQLHDNPVTRYVDETDIRDGRIDVVGVDATAQHPVWGYLGVAASFTRGDHASTLKGLQTFGGDSGQTLAERWLGQSTQGTGKLFAAGLNYTFSLGRMVNAPAPFANDRPDVVVNVGAVLAYTLMTTPLPVGTTTVTEVSDEMTRYNHRFRYKFGADVLYTFKAWMAAGLRADRVAPTSKDATETFYVLAPRLVFKRSWNSREAITLIYAKWFYGAHSHAEAGSVVSPNLGLDDQLIALNVNLWW